MSRFRGRTAIVTGASRGIGLAIAATLLEQGANVCLTARTAETLGRASASLGAPDRVVWVAGHAADPAHRASTVDLARETFGSVDMLVNNTGVNPLFGPLLDAELDAVARIFDTNVVAALGWIQSVYGAGGQTDGAIVNVASVAGLRAAPMIGAYAASKAALVQLTRQLAVELGPSIRVNAVAPAVVRTRFAEALYAGKEDQVAAAYPLRRLGTSEDVAGAVAFLLSDQAAWITGEILTVDGGLLNTGGVAT